MTILFWTGYMEVFTKKVRVLRRELPMITKQQNYTKSSTQDEFSEEKTDNLPTNH